MDFRKFFSIWRDPQEPERDPQEPENTAQEPELDPQEPQAEEPIAASTIDDLLPQSQIDDIVASAMRPVSLERVCAIFDQDNYRYEYSREEEQIDIGFDGFGFRFRLAGEQNEIIHMTSAYLEPIELAQEEELLQFIEDWHRDRIWPKLFYINYNEIELRINAEYAFDCERGINDQQLYQLIKCFVGTSHQAFTALIDQLNLPPTQTGISEE